MREFTKSLKIYIAALRWGWLVHAINVLTAYQVYASVADIPNDFSVLIPLWGWIAVLVAGLLFAPIFPFHKMRLELNKFHKSQANLVFEKVFETALFGRYTDGRRVAKYHVIEAWFKNKPLEPVVSAMAKQVTAIIEFWSWDTRKLSFGVFGQWITETDAPGHGGFAKTYHKIDILPNDEYYKLIIALKWEDEDDGFGYARESFTNGNIDGRDASKKIPAGRCPIKITLKGAGIAEDYFFVLTNPGKGGVLDMEEMPMKKKDAKSKKHEMSVEEFHKILKKASQPIKKSEKGKS